MRPIAIYALTKAGADLGHRLAKELGADLFLHKRCPGPEGAMHFESLRHIVENNFFGYDAHVFIAATGIVVRVIAPLITSKDRDPAIVVLDQMGKFCISLLSGHLGGANALARQIASITGGQAVITTATDTAGIISVDLLAKERNMAIGNIDAVKTVNGAMLAGEVVQVFDPEDRLGLFDRECRGEIMVEMVNSLEQWQPSVPGIRVSWKKAQYEPSTLVLYPKCLVAGIGCNRDTPAEEILDAIRDAFHQNNLALASLKALASIDAKRDEAGLIRAAQVLKTELLFFNKEALGAIIAPNPSERVKFHVGVDSVCEAAAILATGKGSLIVPKTKTKNVTVAVALAP